MEDILQPSCLPRSRPGGAGAQDLRSGPYELPYKNTYVKEVFVAENDFRTMKPETIRPRSFAEAPEDSACTVLGGP